MNTKLEILQILMSHVSAIRSLRQNLRTILWLAGKKT